MDVRNRVSRRSFVGGLTTALGLVGITPGSLLAQAPGGGRGRTSADDYDSLAKLASNENNWGISEPVMKAMNDAWKYANRYGYPDGGITQAIAAHHGVTTDHVLLGAGSGEILNVVGTTYLQGGKKVVGVEPSYNSVYQHASGIRADAIKLPLDKDYRQNIPAMIDAVKKNYREVGLVYLCNPNNPTGLIVTKQEVKQLLDAIPEDIPVLIDEAYHHYVEDPNYEESIPYVKQGRKVIVARTFSKIAALAAMRLGYAVAPPSLIQEMRAYSVGSINALVKWGGVASLKDTATQAKVRAMTRELRERYSNELRALGYEVIPSQTNFFMVGIKRQIQPVIQEFRQRGVLVGRPFPPMTEHMRVSIGTEEEMERFMTAFRQIFPATRPTTAG
ncbi:MAG: aminotransferase class I/II-fold pyridoxal phosphate-dependent enzyme [Acidobacteriota bacterium]